MENLKIEGVLRAPASLHRRYENRPSHALVIKCGGSSRYSFAGRTLVLSPGEVLFLPKGACYTVQRLQPQKNDYCLINFQADIPHPEPILATTDHRLDYGQLCYQLTDLQLIHNAADRYRLLCLFYSLAACISEAETAPEQPEPLVRRLTPALAYLRQHMFDPGLKITQLPSLCNLSDTYFRQLFFRCFGMTPKKYVTEQRLHHAQAVLKSGEYDTIAQVAYLSGFEDPLYFSKVFRKQYGHPPSGL